MNKKQFKIYTASAGSGKTYTLVKEFLTLSLSSDYPSCKDILAVTFTNKAANEMKAKILFYLDGFIANNPKCESMKNDVIKALGIDARRVYQIVGDRHNERKTQRNEYFNACFEFQSSFSPRRNHSLFFCTAYAQL